jgi:hypothetical protein
MGQPRTVPLFDPEARPASWNERMALGEYAVHYSNFDSSTQGSGPTCTILSSLAEAEEYAKQQVSLQPNLRCRIYDHQGFIGAPIKEIKGDKYVGESEITSRFRRWAGSVLFFGGLLLTLVDWRVDFKLGWPAMFGTRLMVPGFTLLVIEALVMLHENRKRADQKHQGLA